MSRPARNYKQLSQPIRWLLLASGMVAVALGVLGIFLPVLPTVPFLLLAAACFTRSSDKFYSWLLDHAHLGPIVRPYLDGEGLKSTTKVKAISLIWTSIALSIYLLDNRILLQATLVIVALGVTTYLVRLPTLEADDS